MFNNRCLLPLSWVYTWFSKIPEYRRRAGQHLAPLIIARQKELDNSDEKPVCSSALFRPNAQLLVLCNATL